MDRPNGANVVAFAGKKGQPLRIQAESQALGLALTPAVRVLDGAGKALARAEPAKLGADVELSFAPPRDDWKALDASAPADLPGAHTSA